MKQIAFNWKYQQQKHIICYLISYEIYIVHYLNTEFDNGIYKNHNLLIAPSIPTLYCRGRHEIVVNKLHIFSNSNIKFIYRSSKKSNIWVTLSVRKFIKRYIYLMFPMQKLINILFANSLKV